MYGIQRFDWQTLVGAELESAVFAANVISLAFTGRKNVSVSNQIRFATASTEPLSTIAPSMATSSGDATPQLEKAMRRLVGRVVEGADILSEQSVVLRFARGGSLELVDDLPNYDCIVVTTEDGVVAI